MCRARWTPDGAVADTYAQAVKVALRKKLKNSLSVVIALGIVTEYHGRG